jgi:putative peptidoglycan lipid II flippase
MSKGLFKSVSLISLMTFISRILGFVRDSIVAQLFGVGPNVDAFYIAFKIPNFMRNIFAEGAFSQAFIPILSGYRQDRTKEEVRLFIRHISAALFFILMLVTISGIQGAPYLIRLFAPGLEAYRFQLACDMLRITFPYLILISFSALVASILNSYNNYGIPAFTPALLNICLIATAFTLSHFLLIPIESQAWGVLIAGCMQILFQLPSLSRIGFSILPKLSWQDAGVRRVLTLIIPAIFGASTAQISVLVNTILASFLTVGSVSWLYYSERLAYFPVGIFGVALVTVILTQLSRQHAMKSEEGFSRVVDGGMRCNLLIGLPASLTMLILSGPLIVSLFQYGKFTLQDVLMTQQSVLAYSAGLQAFMLIKVLSAAFYARQDVRTPVKISIISLVMGMLLSCILVGPLKHAGLALATGLSAWINTGLLLAVLYKKGIYRIQAGWRKFSLQLVFANSMLALLLWWNCGNLLFWINLPAFQRIVHLLWLGCCAVFFYVFCLWLSNLKLTSLRLVTG